MSSYTHFTLEERKCLQELLSEGKSFRKIADILGRNVSSVSREIKRNRSKYTHKKSNNPYKYHAWRAQTLTIIRRRESKNCRLQPDTAEWDYIVEKLNLYWSPEQICERWKVDYPEREKFGTSTVYRYIKSGKFEGISKRTHLRRHGKKLMPRNSSYNSIQPTRIIPEWTDEIKSRSRIGDWEGDTVYGGVGKGLLVTLVDRKSRFLKAGLLEKRSSDLTKDVVVELLNDVKVSSISFDNGSEFAQFKDIEESLNTLVYFAEPHKPWQRGTNENTNDILRFFFPKGFDFHSISQDDVDFVVDLLNNRPRKCLNWHTPAEIFYDF